MTIAEKLITIADNTPRVAEAVKAARVTASGTVVRVDDVLDAEHSVKVQLRSKNLFNMNAPQYSGNLYTSSEVVGDALVVTAKDAAQYRSANFLIPDGDSLIGKQVTLRGEWEASGANKGALALIWTGKTNIHASVQRIGGTSSSGGEATYTITHKPEAAGELCLFLYVNSDGTSAPGNTVTYRNVQVEVGDTATAFTPYTENFSGISVESNGKNLLSDLSKWANGKNILENAHPIHMKAGKKYTFSHNGDYTAWRLMFYGTQMDGSPFPYDPNGGDGQYSNYYIGCNGGTYTASPMYDIVRFQIGNNITKNFVVLTCNSDFILTAIQFWVTGTETTPYTQFQLEEGDAETDHEPYKPIQTAVADENGKVTGLMAVSPTMTVTPDNPGVTVECTYFPQSAASTYQSYQQLKTAQKNLKEELS